MDARKYVGKVGEDALVQSRRIIVDGTTGVTSLMKYTKPLLVCFDGLDKQNMEIPSLFVFCFDFAVEG